MNNDRSIAMCADRCTDMCIDMCIDMYTNMYMNMSTCVYASAQTCV